MSQPKSENSASASTTRRRRRKIIPILVLGFASLAAILACEAALRLTRFSYPVITRSDPDMGYAFVPNLRFEHRTEGYSVVDINRFGFRDPDWSIDKPENTYRIAVVGDSFIAALEVAKEKRLTDLLAKQLTDSETFAGRQVEVMNFGQPGFGTAQELQVLRHRVLQFKPDMVLLAVFTGNDIRNNLFELEQEPIVPYFTLSDGNLQLDESFRQQRRGKVITLVKAMAPYSRLVQLAYRFVHAMESSPAEEADARQAMLRAEFGFIDPATETAIYAEPQTDAWRQAWDLTESLISQFQEDVVQTGATFGLITLTNDVQVLPSIEQRAKLQAELGVNDLLYPDRRIQAYCQTHQIPSLHLAEPIQATAESKQQHFHGFENTRIGFGHWNEQGHAEVAGHVKAWIESFFGRLEAGG